MIEVSGVMSDRVSGPAKMTGLKVLEKAIARMCVRENRQGKSKRPEACRGLHFDHTRTRTMSERILSPHSGDEHSYKGHVKERQELKRGQSQPDFPWLLPKSLVRYRRGLER